MNAIQQRCRPKHQVLVLKCYPRTTKGAVDVKPNSSELSYLLFYATSRRSKIQKIGSFLEKKTASDVWRMRIGNVQVTLQILAALIEKSPKDLPLFATCVLKILDLILGSKDVTMAESSIPTFEAFCENHDASSSFADQAYLAQYESVVRSYAALASTRQTPGKGSPSQPVLMRWRNVGLEAIRCVSSADPLSSVVGRQFAVVVPIILENLWWDNEEFLDVLLSRVQLEEKVDADKLLRRRTSIATVRTVDTAGDTNPIALVGTAFDVDKLAEEDIAVLAMQCLKQIFVVPNRPQIHAATSAFLKFVNERVSQREPVVRTDPKSGKDNGWAIKMYGMISRWAPVQDRYVILVTTLDTLTRMPITEDNLQQHIVLAAMISSLLRSDVNLIGLSVMDVLLGLVKHMKRLLQLPGAFTKAEESMEDRSPSAVEASETITMQKRDLLSRIQQCIGDLATHVYYADQISDMISAILLRLKPARSSSTNSSPHGEKAEVAGTGSGEDLSASQPHLDAYFSFNVGKTAALKAIKSILLVANPKTKVTGNMSLSRHKVPIQVWEGTHWLLRDPDGLVRKAYVDAVLTWLDRETTKADLKARDDGTHHPRTSAKNGREIPHASFARRAASSASNRDKPSKVPRSTFLQLLHLAIYDNALQFMDYETDIVYLHVLLAKLVTHMGVNAVRYGLPMIFRLQEDIQDAETPLQKVRLGSLCHGYFWTITDIFDVDASVVGRAIQNEIIRRRSKNFWVEGIHVPPPLLELVGTPGMPRPQPKLPLREIEYEALLPFDDRISLVECIATSYADTSISPPTSPAGSPGRSFTHPMLGSTLSAPPAETDRELPNYLREQMLVDWSRDSVMMALQAGSKSASLTGSKTGTTGTNRHRLALNGGGANGHSHNGHTPPFGSQQNLRPGSVNVPGTGVGQISKLRRSSLRSGVSPSPSESSRGFVASVEQLKMVLSGHLSATPAGTAVGLNDDESGSDSVASYDFTPSELSFNPASQPDGVETGATLTPQRSMSQSIKGGPLSSNPPLESSPVRGSQDGDEDNVPPVPPLPTISGLSGKGSDIPQDRISTISTQDHAFKSGRRNISSRGGESTTRSPLREESSAAAMDLQDLLKRIDSRAGEHSLGAITKPPY